MVFGHWWTNASFPPYQERGSETVYIHVNGERVEYAFMVLPQGCINSPTHCHRVDTGLPGHLRWHDTGSILLTSCQLAIGPYVQEVASMLRGIAFFFFFFLYVFCFFFFKLIWGSHPCCCIRNLFFFIAEYLLLYDCNSIVYPFTCWRAFGSFLLFGDYD